MAQALVPPCGQLLVVVEEAMVRDAGDADVQHNPKKETA